MQREGEDVSTSIVADRVESPARGEGRLRGGFSVQYRLVAMCWSSHDIAQWIDNYAIAR